MATIFVVVFSSSLSYHLNINTLTEIFNVFYKSQYYKILLPKYNNKTKQTQNWYEKTFNKNIQGISILNSIHVLKLHKPTNNQKSSTSNCQVLLTVILLKENVCVYNKCFVYNQKHKCTVHRRFDQRPQQQQQQQQLAKWQRRKKSCRKLPTKQKKKICLLLFLLILFLGLFEISVDKLFRFRAVKIDFIEKLCVIFDKWNISSFQLSKKKSECMAGWSTKIILSAFISTSIAICYKFFFQYVIVHVAIICRYSVVGYMLNKMNFLANFW